MEGIFFPICICFLISQYKHIKILGHVHRGVLILCLHDLKDFCEKLICTHKVPKVKSVGILSCSSRTDKNELCVLVECILHPTCCIVIKVPPALYYYYTSYLASMSFIRSTVFAFWSQIPYRRHRLAAAAHRLSGWVWLQCPVLGFTRQKCDPILTGLMLPATLLLLL